MTSSPPTKPAFKATAVAPRSARRKPAPASSAKPAAKPAAAADAPAPAAPARKPEVGGPKGPEPTRYGDWEKGGRCVDF